MKYRQQIISSINARITKQEQLIWIGLRGSDAEPLLEFEQFSHSFSIISPLDSSDLSEECLELFTRHRVDLNRYSTEFDNSEELKFLIHRIVKAVERPSVIVAYRPLELITSIYYSRSTSVRYLGLFHGLQSIFEYKPWVEFELRNTGVSMIPWKYLNREDLSNFKIPNNKGDLILRVSRSSGGSGFYIIREPQDLVNALNSTHERLFALAPYLKPNIPLNVNACIFPSGDITIHGPSLQLIGIESCIHNELGYCGNDFARIRDIEPSMLDEFEKVTIKIGRWLYSKGYIGAFGIDALIYNGNLYVSEVNPRLQGSSKQAALIDSSMDNVDIFLAHMASFLGIAAPKSIPCQDLARSQDQIAQIYCFNPYNYPVTYNGHSSTAISPLLLPNLKVAVNPDAMLFRLVLPGPITDDGSNLSNGYEMSIREFVLKSLEKAQNEK